MSKKRVNTKFDYLEARPASELPGLLRERLDVLQVLCREYDASKRYFATDIALKLRVLLLSASDKKNPSLLQQLDMLGTKFFDTVETINNGDPHIAVEPAAGMAVSTVHMMPSGHEQDWQPTCYFRFPNEVRTTSFKSWWETPFLTVGSHEFSRRQITKQLAEFDGGGHVAPQIERVYFDLTRGKSEKTARQIIDGDAVTDPTLPIAPERITAVSRHMSGTRLVRAVVRQIAHETIMTLSSESVQYLAGLPSPIPGVAPIMMMQFHLVKPRAYPGRA